MRYLSEDDEGDLKERLRDQYGESCGKSLSLAMEPLGAHLGGFGNDYGNIKGLKVLCLCPGGKKVEEGSSRVKNIDLDWLKGYYQPWIPRLFHMLGANVTAVDAADLSDERYETRSQIDLRYPWNLQEFETDSMDVISMYSAGDVLYRGISTGLVPGLAKRFIEQLHRLLRSDGIFLTLDADRLLRRAGASEEHTYLGRDADKDWHSHLDSSLKTYRAMLNRMIGEHAVIQW